MQITEQLLIKEKLELTQFKINKLFKLVRFRFLSTNEIIFYAFLSLTFLIKLTKIFLLCSKSC